MIEGEVGWCGGRAKRKLEGALRRGSLDDLPLELIVRKERKLAGALRRFCFDSERYWHFIMSEKRGSSQEH